MARDRYLTILHPERNLWQEVLLRVIMDARLDPSSWPVPKSTYEDTAEARAYLSAPSKDLAAVCAMAGMDMDALLDRMRERLAEAPPLIFDEDAPGQKRPRMQDRLIEHAGRCLTLARWSEVTGLSQNVIRKRLHKGWTVADALTVPVGVSRGHEPKVKPERKVKPPLTLTYQGETLTYRQWADRIGLSWFTIRDRARKGWPVEEVLRPDDLRGAHMRVDARDNTSHE